MGARIVTFASPSRTLRGTAGGVGLGAAGRPDMGSVGNDLRPITLAARFSQSGFLHRAQTSRQSCLHSMQVPWRKRSRTGAWWQSLTAVTMCPQYSHRCWTGFLPATYRWYAIRIARTRTSAPMISPTIQHWRLPSSWKGSADQGADTPPDADFSFKY